MVFSGSSGISLPIGTSSRSGVNATSASKAVTCSARESRYQGPLVPCVWAAAADQPSRALNRCASLF